MCQWFPGLQGFSGLQRFLATEPTNPVCRITHARLPHDIVEIQNRADNGAAARMQLAMIKLVYCITKKAGLTDQEFYDYWKNVHGPIGTRIPGLRKLVQSHRLIIPGDREPTFDGMAELWFDDAGALFAARQSPEWRASHQDEFNFIDHNKVAYFVSEEHTVLGKSAP
jgi:uncharacterized protein (TIGR02118 family)